MPGRVYINELCEHVAASFADSGNLTPSHCDVRCAVNDLMDGYEREGMAVPHGYNQDRAYKSVRRMLKGYAQCTRS